MGQWRYENHFQYTANLHELHRWMGPVLAD